MLLGSNGLRKALPGMSSLQQNNKIIFRQLIDILDRQCYSCQHDNKMMDKWRVPNFVRGDGLEIWELDEAGD